MDRRESSGGNGSRSRSRSRSRDLPNVEQTETKSSSSREREQGRSSRRESHTSSRDHERRRERRSRSRSAKIEVDSLKMHWKPIKENSRDFDAWVRLLAYVEHLDETKAGRQAYDEFLKRYPYCYGYWRKYADFERRHKHDRCIEVYERGVKAIPLSVDIWLHYISFASETFRNELDGTTKVREIFTRAINDCGLEFRSDKLWEEFIDWEITIGETKRAGALFDQLLSVPTFQYHAHFERYRKFIRSHEPDQVISETEYDEIFTKTEESLKSLVDGELYLIEEVTEDIPAFNSIVEIDEKDEPVVKMRRKHCEEALRSMRTEIIERRRLKFALNEAEVGRRWVFEENIKRPYFHVKPLESSQIKNWQAYLDMEIANGDSKRVIVLFERSLIACALYGEMWLKYVDYLESIGDESRVCNVYKRAADIHLPRNPKIHLAYSGFEEKRGDFAKAINILVEFDRRQPGFAEINIRRIGIERRMAIKEAGASGSIPDYEPVITRFEKLIYDSSVSRKLSSSYSLRLARFHFKIRQDRVLAEKVIKNAIHHDPGNPRLYMALVDFVYSLPEFNEKEVIETLDYAINCERLSSNERLRFSLRKLDFLEDFSIDVKDIQAHAKFHAKLQKIADEEKKMKKNILEMTEKKPQVVTSTYALTQHPASFFPAASNHPINVGHAQPMYGLQHPQQPPVFPANTFYYGNQVTGVQPVHQQRIF